MALSGRSRIWGAALCMVHNHPFNGVGARGFREAFPQCDPHSGQVAAWGEGPALHAHQIVLEILSETGAIGIMRNKIFDVMTDSPKRDWNAEAMEQVKRNKTAAEANEGPYVLPVLAETA